MGATRPASGKCKSLYTKQRLTDSTNYTPVCAFALMPDNAGRVAPIRAQFPGITVLPMASNLLFNLSI